MKTHDDQLDRLFKSLPMEEADAYFTRKVTNRLKAGDESPFRYRKLLYATAAAVAVSAVLAPLFLSTRGNPEREALMMELASIRSEYSELQAEKASLGKSGQNLPVFYLGGNDRTDFVLDVNKLDLGVGESRGPNIKPANYKTDNNQLKTGSDQRGEAGYHGGAI